MITIAKDFYWEMGHRLPNHDGLCRHLHGHSYSLRLILQGHCNNNGMLIDYFDLDNIVKKILEKYNHSFIVDENDTILIAFLKENSFKHNIIPYVSTAENLCDLFSKELLPEFKKYGNITKITIRLRETQDVYAEKTYQN